MGMKATFRNPLGPAATATSVLLVAACSNDPTAATDANFEKALNQLLGEQSCIQLPQNYDRKAPALPLMQPGEPKEILKELTAVGIFKASPAMATTMLGGQLPGNRFELTERGRGVVRTRSIATTLGREEIVEACIGRFEVSEVVRSTEPADRFGYRVSEVSYRYRWVDYPEWASPLAPEKEMEGKAVLAATSDGWVPMSSLQGR